MNATSLDELRAGLASKRDANDDRMDQIRDLLIGDYLRANEARFASLEGRLRDLEGLVFRRVDALSARIEALSGEVGADRRTSFDDLSRMVTELGDSIRRISRS
jgi:hypothetical protein